MKNKQLLLVILVMGIMSSLACVSASQQDGNLTSDFQVSSQTDSISGLIVNAKDNDTIYLDNITYEGEKNTQITIDKSISIVGSDNTIIDGKNERSLFVINDNVKVSFKNIKFVNATKTGTGDDIYGGALDIHNADVVIDNCQFISNSINHGKSDRVFGAAISNKGNLSIFNSYFLENSLNSGYKQEGFGGAIYNNGWLYVNNTSFIKSKGKEYSKGSVIYNDNVALINNSVLADTYSLEDSMGSAIFNNGYLTLLNSRIENNTIERNNFNFIYGNVFNSGLLIAKGNIFKNNTGYYKQPNSGYEGCPTIYNVGDLNLSYNAFIDNVGGFEKIYTDVYLNGGKSIYIDNNWWGGNANPFETHAINVDKVNSWLILNVAPSYSTINLGESVNITASWTLSNGLKPQILPPLEVIFKDEFGHTQMSNLENDECIFIFNDTHNRGLYTVDAYVNSFKESVCVDVGKIKTNIEFSVNKDSLYYDENLVVGVQLYDENSNLLGEKVSVSIAGQKIIIDLKEGDESALFTKLRPDTYELKIEYFGNDIYSRSSAATNITFKKYPIKFSIEEIGDIYVDENFTINVNLASEEMEGSANLYINGVYKQVVYLKSGDTIISFSNFNEGIYNLTIEMLGNEYYKATNASTVFNVKKYDSKINISSSNIFIKENETLIITTSNEFMGEVILSINDVNNTLFLKDTNTEITLTNLSAGRYDVDLIFKGNGKFKAQKASSSFNVLRYSSNLMVNIHDNQINVKTQPNNCTGSVDVYINRKCYQLNLTNGEANFNVEYDKGTNYIYVFYSGDDYYSTSSFNTTVGEGEAVAIIGENITSYEYNDFNYTVSIFEQNGFAMPNKVITIKINSKTHEIVTNSQGIAVLPLNLKEGHYEVISTYKNLTTTNYITINPIKFNLTAINITHGENAFIKAEFDKNIIGKVNFTLSNGLTTIEDIVDGIATYTIQNLTFGTWNVTAFYANGLFNSTSKTVSFEVERLESDISLDIPEAFAGQDQTIIAKANDLTGNITFIIDSIEYNRSIQNGEARIVASGLEGGSHVLKVVYGGDASHKNTTLIKEFTVKTQRTGLLIEIGETAYGEIINVTAKVDITATGNITFSVKNINASSQIINGTAIWSFAGLDVGTYTINAEYSGDSVFMSTSASSNFKIIKAKSTIEVYVKEVVLDENIRIYARVSANATGKVSFRMEGYYSPRDKSIENSTASWLISPLQTGQYTVIATYRGDANYYSSTATYILNVSQKRSVLSVRADDVSNNENSIIKASLTSIDGVAITGLVNVQLNDKSYKINVRDGEGTLNLGRLNPAEYTVKASFEGDEDFSSASASCDFTVSDSLLKSIIRCENVKKYYNGDAEFVISLTNAKNRPISHQTVYVSIKGVETAYTTDEDGKIRLNISNEIERYNVTVQFRGSESYHPSNATATVEVLSTIESDDVVKLYGSGVQYFSMFRDSTGKALSSENVVFKIAGKTYNYTTLPNGIVRLNINLPPAKYSIVAINPKTGESKTNVLFIFNKLMGNRDVANYFGLKSTYKVRAYGSDGKPMGAGVVVTFKVNGRTYKIKTDANGYATLSVKLNAKQYVVTAQFNGTIVSNKITVKPVLTTKITSNKKTKTTRFTAKLVNTKGKVLKAKRITFKINGKTYAAKTNKYGVASVNIKLTLKRGTYRVYTIYGKSKVVNTIKVK